jgi:hypothetical protein
VVRTFLTRFHAARASRPGDRYGLRINEAAGQLLLHCPGVHCDLTIVCDPCLRYFGVTPPNFQKARPG